jgi:hypothetical protein
MILTVCWSILVNRSKTPFGVRLASTFATCSHSYNPKFFCYKNMIKIWSPELGTVLTDEKVHKSATFIRTTYCWNVFQPFFMDSKWVLNSTSLCPNSIFKENKPYLNVILAHFANFEAKRRADG